MPENNKVMFNGQVVMDISDSTADANNMLAGTVGYTGSGVRTVGTATKGHTIKNPAGTSLTQRDNLKFSDGHISDDSTNNQTIVDIVKEVTTAQFANETERGLYRITDKPDSVINAEQVAYDSNDSVKQKIDEVDGKVGLTNLTSAYFSHTTGTDKYYIEHNVDSSKAGQVTIDTDGLHILNKNSGTWAEKYVLKPIKTKTVTVTTNSNGVANLDTSDSAEHILSVYVQDRIATHFWVGSGHANWVKVEAWTDRGAIEGTVSVTYTYI